MMSDVVDELAEADGGSLPVSMMYRSGARGNDVQLRQLFGMSGLLADTFGRIVEFPMRDRFMTGIGQMSYFLRSNGARSGLAMTVLRTASAGDLMRRIVEALGDDVIIEDDCGTAGTRGPVTCASRGGVCAKCHGDDVAHKRPVEVGSPVGMAAALSLGEPLTQLTMRSFHLGHKYPFGKIARGKPEQDIKYSSGFPRLEEVFETFEKRRAYGPALDGVDERPTPQSILDDAGEPAARRYLLDELSRVYAEAGVHLHRNHFEIAVRQMMAHVEVDDPGDTGLVPGRQLHRDEWLAANEAARRPATAKPLLLPISEVALRTGSFLAAAASWQTVKILIRAAVRHDVDSLRGMRENVLLGRLIPTPPHATP